jgi:hypothetical protein
VFNRAVRSSGIVADNEDGAGSMVGKSGLSGDQHYEYYSSGLGLLCAPGFSLLGMIKLDLSHCHLACLPDLPTFVIQIFTQQR